MKSLILLVVSLATVAHSQAPTSPDVACLTLRLQNQTECVQQLATLASLDILTFCGSQCAATLRDVYNGCGFTGTNNQVALVCDSTGSINPDVTCLARELQSATGCLTLLSGDPTAFCTSDCYTEVSDAFAECRFSGPSNPISTICGSSSNLTGPNPACLASRLSSLSNCALELASSPSVFCASQCAQAVRQASDDCGFTGTANIVNNVCVPGNTQDPICIGNRLQNLGGCVSIFLNNVSSFCDSSCSDTLTTAYNECGYTGFSNPVTTACSGQQNPFGQDTLCLTSRLQQLDSCVREITQNPNSFCSSDCRTQVRNAYVDCGFHETASPAYTVCFAVNSTGPDSICLGERLAGLQSCVTTFLTYPTTFCSSECYTDLNDAYNDCGFTGPQNNPFFYGCVVPSGEDPLCLSRELLNLQDCVSIILTNQTAFCGSACQSRVSNAFEGCGYVNASNPANICFIAGPDQMVEQCLATRLPTVDGCLTGFVNNPTTFCMSECATNTRTIYQECGYFGLNPVDQLCATSGQDPLCLVYGLQNQTDCLGVLLSNSTAFCTSSCYSQVSTAYSNCGLSGPSNPVETACSASTQTQDPICLSTRTQSLTLCLGQLLVDTVSFCNSSCADQVSSAYNDCGYTGFSNPVQQTCSASVPGGTDTCLTSSPVYQQCITELSTNPNGFCTSTCATGINNLFTQCGLPPTANPTSIICSGLVPNQPGQPNPTCLASGLSNLQDCVDTIVTDQANFCTTPCAADLSTAYEECGYDSTANPVSLLCSDTGNGDGDLACLNSALSNSQECITQLATNPSDFCNSQCSVELKGAYDTCGFLSSANPVDIACGGGLPNQDPFCISGKLTGLQDCTSKLGTQDFCVSECESELRTAYSECGFTGTTNPVSILCSGTEGRRDVVCLGTQLQLHTECVSELFSNPQTLCSTGSSDCSTTLQNAYTTCGYMGSDNPIGTTCRQTGSGAGALQAIPMALSLTLLLVLAAIFY